MLSIAGQIQTIEFARRTDGREDVCVCIGYESSDELKVWKGPIRCAEKILPVLFMGRDGLIARLPQRPMQNLLGRRSVRIDEISGFHFIE